MIHRYWSAPPGRPSHIFTTRVLAALHPDIEIKDWSDRDLPPEALEIMDATSHRVIPAHLFRHRSNIARWWLLREYGGWFVDHDVVALQRFDTLPSPATAMHRGGNRCTCWLAFPAGHPLPDAVLQHAQDPGTQEQLPSMELSGEAVLTRLADHSIAALPLPLDSDGGRHPTSTLWMVHLHEGAV